MTEFSSESGDEEETYKFKVVLLGPASAGKTALVLRLAHGIYGDG
jgi:GTPase SAR1 family protein